MEDINYWKREFPAVANLDGVLYPSNVRGILEEMA